ncbi:hypothetical protein U0070_006500 [Myodes glareolus]|uniref:G-protein coupled receptors family 1 profile domain-containing protein n=1 Tax=Myodes glareolus TaxID=447135 RepID=A0AAW0H9A9_MYOGA
MLGNCLILFTVFSTSQLHSPMFFLLSNLSLIDICLSSFATPKMIMDFFAHHKTISFEGCISQIFLLHLFTGTEIVLLISMSFDREEEMGRIQCKNSSNNLKGNMTSPESREHKTRRIEHPTPEEIEEIDSKRIFMKIIEELKQEVKISHKEMEETRSPQSCSLARWAWAVGSVRQGQLWCFESLPQDRQVLSQLNHIPGQQERVNF